MPKIEMVVTNERVGYSWLFNYESRLTYGPVGSRVENGVELPGTLGYQPDKLDTWMYLVPTYRMILKVEGKIVCEYEVIRFGISRRVAPDGTDTGKITGLADEQAYPINFWKPDYTLHSNRRALRGAWHVDYKEEPGGPEKNYRVHSGPEDPRNENAKSFYGASGCIEICNSKFTDLNRRILRYSGLTSLKQVATTKGMLGIAFQGIRSGGVVGKRLSSVKSEAHSCFSCCCYPRYFASIPRCSLDILRYCDISTSHDQGRSNRLIQIRRGSHSGSTPPVERYGGRIEETCREA
ncbi:MAG: hypothetical protein V1792_04790, partial [Pseudomonadota bacterium]